MLPTTLEIIKKSFSLYKNNKLLFLKFSLVVIIPVLLTGYSRALFLQPIITHSSIPLLLIAAGVIFLLNLVTLLGTITFVRVIYNRYVGNPADSLTRELRLSLPLLLSSLWIVILTTLAVLGGLLLFIIPGIIFSIWFFFSVYAGVLDHKKGSDALHWSHQLVKGYTWEVLWLLLSSSFLFFGSILILQTIIRFVFTFLSTSMPSTSLFLSLGLVTIIGLNILVAPLSASITTIIYAELKKLKQS